jgi:hypothetical protein
VGEDVQKSKKEDKTAEMEKKNNGEKECQTAGKGCLLKTSYNSLF